MTDLLKRVLEVAGAVLPAEDQNELAESILEDLRSEAGWDAELTDTQGLRMMAEEALAEYRAGKTKALDINEL